MIQKQRVGMISIVFFLLLYSSILKTVEWVNFDDSMQLNVYHSVFDNGSSNVSYSFFKLLYEKQALNYVNDKQLRIPLYMHHVWFGNPLSDYFKALRKTWIDNHPAWVHILWTDNAVNDELASVVYSFQELDTLLANGGVSRIVVVVDKLSFNNRQHFDAARNYGERSDILKWEIVYRYGGVYIDVDFECYKPLDTLHYCFDFYTGLQPLDTGRVQLGAALFAAHPYHPILERCVKDINPGIGPIVIRTGPIHFTLCCMRTIKNCKGNNIVFPASYFYPCGYEQRSLHPSLWYKKEAYAIHHWSGSWLSADAFVKSK